VGRKLTELERRINYSFNRRELLERALLHRSYAFEKGMAENYEVLEFLGDSVIGLIVSEILVERFPQKSEGELSQIRAFLVSEASLSRLARSIELGKFILLGRGERKTGGEEKESILCDVLEALFGAIYLDSDFETARRVFREVLLEEMWRVFSSRKVHKDYKSQLQEYAQGKLKTRPAYEIVEERGPEHRKEFTVRCSLAGKTATGRGRSKKEAQQEAARKMLEILGVRLD